jgi:diadenosine tetraphosphatase ApaH/serine/threonine PP2A family protein phosphatase
MKYAIISDVHANLPALRAVLTSLPADCELLHLGDLVGYGPEPNAVLDALRAIRGVRGNHDDGALGILGDDWFSERAKHSTIWTRERLTSDSRAILEALPYELVVDDAELPFTIVHGSPHEHREFHYVLGNNDAMRAMKHFRTQVAFVGHSHYPESYGRPPGSGRINFERHGDEKRDPDELVIADGFQYVVNVGSVGQPRDRNPKASYAVLDTSLRTVTWKRVPYDIAAVQAAIRRAGLDEKNALRLAHGE